MIYVIQHTLHNGDQMWWRPDGRGYTAEIVAAGCYTQQRAEGAEKARPQDKAVPLTEALAGLEKGTVGSFFGMHIYRGEP